MELRESFREIREIWEIREIGARNKGAAGVFKGKIKGWLKDVKGYKGKKVD